MLAAFGVGLANFGSGLERSPRQVVQAVRDVLPFVAWYGGTGNVVVDDADVERAREVLAAATGTSWPCFPLEELAKALDILATLPVPPHAADERPTPGLAFAVSPAREGEVAPTDRAALKRISDGVVAIRKLDPLRAGKLDRERRRGGWGAVSADISKQIGGQWTSRSRRTIDGLRARTRSRRRR